MREAVLSGYGLRAAATGAAHKGVLVSGRRGAGAHPMTTGQKVGVGFAVFCVVAVVYALIAPKAATTTTASPPTAAAGSSAPAAKPTTAPRPTAAKAQASPEPTFVYPGDAQCAITYRDRGDGTMSWTATVTVAGELITHAGDSAGNLYPHDTQVGVGQSSFAAPVPLSSITDVGGNLTGSDGTSYGCSVAPAK